MSFPLCSNERVKDSLSKLILSNRLPHAIIIEGEKGTGKRTISAYIAKAALCEAADRPCSVCRSCHLADVGTHPDIERVALEENKKMISVKQIDHIREIAYLTPHTASGKVIIIEDANTMNASSQNKLLKILEEPPANVIFILLCEASNQLLDTVVSRCTVFSLYPPDFSSALEVLISKGIGSADAEDALITAKNNIGKALQILGNAKSALGARIASDFFGAIIEGNALEALKITAVLDKNRADADVFVKELKNILIQKVKSSGKLKATRLEYTKMYDCLCKIEPLLVTNINLSLFFTSLTSKFLSIRNH